MTDDSVYEQWKQQRASTKQPDDLPKDVLAMLEEKSSPSRPDYWRSLTTFAAVVAATVLGIARITFSLFLGIQAQ